MNISTSTCAVSASPAKRGQQMSSGVKAVNCQRSCVVRSPILSTKELTRSSKNQARLPYSRRQLTSLMCLLQVQSMLWKSSWLTLRRISTQRKVVCKVLSRFISTKRWERVTACTTFKACPTSSAIATWSSTDGKSELCLSQVKETTKRSEEEVSRLLSRTTASLRLSGD